MLLVRFKLCQRYLLEGEVRMKVGLRGLDRFMAEPQGDHGTVDARL